jgi:hypothetical protein
MSRDVSKTSVNYCRGNEANGSPSTDDHPAAAPLRPPTLRNSRVDSPALLAVVAFAAGAALQAVLAFVFDDKTVVVTLAIRRRRGAQDCQGNAPFSFDLELPEPLGDRRLLDGGESPPRDVTKPPSG